MLLGIFKRFKQVFKPLIMGFGLISLLNVSGCTQVPKGVEPVQNFDLDRYLGQWHEIARLDHSFERGLTDVSATYSMRKDGGVRVINSGFNLEAQALKTAEGRAYFTGPSNVGSLKVSFFGPFYGGYHIAKLDKEYQMALVVGPNIDYAWILARKKQPDPLACEAYFKAAEQLGIARESWIVDAPCE